MLSADVVNPGGSLSVLLRPGGEERQSESVLAGGNGDGGIRLRLGRRLYSSLPLWGLSVGGGGDGGRQRFSLRHWSKIM
jgi:hypothetical protein